MLLTRVRLPVIDLINSLTASSFGESVQAFEHQDPRTILRLPTLSMLAGLRFSQCPVRRSVPSSASGSVRGSLEEHEQKPTDAEAAFAEDAMRALERRQAQHLKVFFSHEKAWPMNRHAQWANS